MKVTIEIIHEWSEKWPFGQLDTDQQMEVIKQLSIEEYNSLYEINRSYNQYFSEQNDTLSPDRSTIRNLIKVYNNKENTKVIPLWNRPFRLYKTIVACLLVFVLSYLLFNAKESTSVIAEHSEKLKVVYDTVIVEKSIVETEVETLFVSKESPKPLKPIPMNYEAVNNEYIIDVAPVPSSYGIARSFGNSAVNTPSLEQFKVQM
ncbi:MAG: hypothetical protein JXR19_03505 [Bacteroidia bacterium]